MSTQYDYDVVVIGSGMGGLTCGTILAAEGMRVCVVEKRNGTWRLFTIFSAWALAGRYRNPLCR